MDPLLVVWELATGDYGWFRQFYPAVRIAEVCENRGIPLRFLFARDIPEYIEALRPDREPAGLPGYRPGEPLPGSASSRGSGRNVPPPRRALIRGMANPALTEKLEDAGIRCVNGSRAAKTANDKLETARLAGRLGIPTPITIDAKEGLTALRSGISTGISFPLVVKPRFGSRGRGVTLAETAEEAETAARILEARFEPAIFQEYIESSRGRDLRVFFSGDRVIAVAERKNPDGGLVSNAAEGGLMVKADLPEPARFREQATFALAREAGLKYGSADFLFMEDGSLTLCELNAAPGFEALEKACGVDAAGAVIEAAMGE